MKICLLSYILNIVQYKLKNPIFLLIILSFMGCKNKTELAMERGIQYYEWEKIEEAVLEFKHVIHNFASKDNKLKYEEIKLLSRAHHNLAVAYSKKIWYTDAAEEAQKAFDLFPTDDNRKILELIQIKLFQNTGSRPEKIGATNQ